MRIKAVKSSFMIGNALVLSGQEIDAPVSDALYLISIGVAVEVQGGKGIQLEVVEPDTEVVVEKAQEAVKAMTTPKRKAVKKEA